LGKIIWRHVGMIAALIALLALVGGCPIRALFGIPCPGCGLSRAWWEAIRLNFSAAFRYHPLWLPAPFLLLYAIHFRVLPARFRPRNTCVVLILCACAYGLLYLYRILIAHDAVLQPDFSNALFPVLFDKIRSFVYT
jgi:hypothetical protein